MSLDAFNQLFPDETSVVSHLAKVKFGPDLKCPHCMASMSIAGKMITCTSCCYRKSATNGTFLAHTKLPLRAWFYLILLIANETGALPANFVARHFGVTPKTAFRMLGCLRLHFQARQFVHSLGGAGMSVQIDETWMRMVKANCGESDRGAIVFGIYGNQGVIACIVNSRSSHDLVSRILRFVEPETTIVTDAWRAYSGLSRLGFCHVVLNHSRGEYANKHGSSIGIEGFWATLKYRLAKANVTPEKRYLDLYLAEHTFFYNCKKQGKSGFLEAIADFPKIDLSRMIPRTCGSRLQCKSKARPALR